MTSMMIRLNVNNWGENTTDGHESSTRLKGAGTPHMMIDHGVNGQKVLLLIQIVSSEAQ